ncbi:14 kDa subunit of cytochrome bd ubiquinol oxidase [Ramicandelaber brevisporus]|nr:14 kDa subunit of cytochrome bd ubiquinol oxidase [Ramicandelaber brevisporus]
MSAPTLAPLIRKSPLLTKLAAPLAKFYFAASGYRKLGLLHDDLIIEENPVVQEAIRRLPEDVKDGRAWRHRVALQLSLEHHELPKEKWTKFEDDVRYLQPYIDEVAAEFKEREMFDAMQAVFKK